MITPEEHTVEARNRLQISVRQVMWSLERKLKEITMFPARVVVVYGLPDIASQEQIEPLASFIEQRLIEAGWYAEVTAKGSASVYQGSHDMTLPKLVVRISKEPLPVPTSRWCRFKAWIKSIFS